MTSETASKQDQVAADQEVQKAMEAVRSNSAKDLCGGKDDDKDRSAA